MPKYVVTIRGVNFLLPSDEGTEPTLMGFYVNAFVESENPIEAETEALELVRVAPKLRVLVMNKPDDRPELFVEETAELTDWPEECVRPLSGFIYYDDPRSEWRSEPRFQSQSD